MCKPGDDMTKQLQSDRQRRGDSPLYCHTSMGRKNGPGRRKETVRRVVGWWSGRGDKKQKWNKHEIRDRWRRGNKKKRRKKLQNEFKKRKSYDALSLNVRGVKLKREAVKQKRRKVTKK